MRKLNNINCPHRLQKERGSFIFGYILLGFSLFYLRQYINK